MTAGEKPLELLPRWSAPPFSARLLEVGFRTKTALKRGILRLRRRLRRHRRPDRSWRPGLPPGLTNETLRRSVPGLADSQLPTTSYQQLSSWKHSGAYRVEVVTSGGVRRRLVYKNCNYSESELPAAGRFPVRPGPIELEIYRNRSQRLRDHLPDVYHAEASRSDEFRLIMEDLGEGYSSAFSGRNLLIAAARLPRLHALLAPVFREMEQDRIPHYDEEFSRRLLSYVAASLDDYAAAHGGPDVEGLLDDLSDVGDAYLSSVSGMELTLVPIHGDYNPANILVDRRRSDRMKVVDWEWAGMGLPHADLAKLLGSGSPMARNLVFDDFVRSYPQWSYREHTVLYTRARLERGLIDASYLARHHLALPGPTRLDIPGYIARGCRTAREAARDLGA